MRKIGIISDTHSYLDKQVFDYFIDVDEIWHAGDIGVNTVTDQLKNFKPLRAVFGNIDGHELRAEFPEDLIFEIEGCKIFITHIAGAVSVYNQRVREIIKQEKPSILVCGHSHILKIMRDEKFNLLHINPGAAGVHGFHKMKTILRFEIENGRPQKMELIELGLRGKIEDR